MKRPAGLLALALLAAPTAAEAQAVRAPTREELQIGENPPAQPSVAPRVVIEGDIERGPCPLADPAYAAVTVDFARVEFVNLGPVPASDLEASWRDLAGREVPIASLCDIRDRAATVLRRQGYLAAVQVPPQRIDKGGVVRMEVLLARLTEVQLRGDPGKSADLIAAQVGKLAGGEYFNVAAAERQLLLLGDLPGYDVRLTLRPGANPGEVFGDLLVMRRALEVIAGLQNLGSQASGRFAGFAQATFNDLTGLGDRTQLSVFNTLQPSEQTVVQISHEFALGTDGWRLGGTLIYGRGEPSLGNVRMKTGTLIGKLEASYPLIRRQSLTLRGVAGAEIIDQTVDFAGIRVSNDRTRMVFARAELDMIDPDSLGKRAGYSDADPLWRLGASIELRQGIGFFGGSRDCTPIANCTGPKAPISNLLADPKPFVIRAEAVVEYRPLPAVALIAAPRAQWTDKAVLGYEQFSLGNYTVGRGLDPGVVQGDKGVGASFELRYGKRRFQRSARPVILPYVFFDAAWAWSNDGGLTPDPRRVLTGGGGARIPWGDRLEANLLAAVPLEKVRGQTKRGDVRFLFTLAARLAPWRD